jgi:hypothetical protein
MKTPRAAKLGFKTDENIDAIISVFLEDEIEKH